jgi:hypothetical protein
MLKKLLDFIKKNPLIILAVIIFATAVIFFLYQMLANKLVTNNPNNKVTLSLTSDPENISAYINNIQYQTPAEIELAPGEYLITASQQGYKNYENKFSLGNTSPQNLKITLEKINITTLPNNSADILKQFALSNLPYKTNDYSIDWDETTGKISIVPDIGIGDTSYEEYISIMWDDYQKKALAAISWIKSKGLDVTDNDIEFPDQGLWPTGKSISISK